MKPPKVFDCVEMKRKIQEKIYEETKTLDPEQLIAYFHGHTETGPFAKLWEKPQRKARSTTAKRRTKS